MVTPLSMIATPTPLPVQAAVAGRHGRSPSPMARLVMSMELGSRPRRRGCRRRCRARSPRRPRPRSRAGVRYAATPSTMGSGVDVDAQGQGARDGRRGRRARTPMTGTATSPPVTSSAVCTLGSILAPCSPSSASAEVGRARQTQQRDGQDEDPSASSFSPPLRYSLSLRLARPAGGRGQAPPAHQAGSADREAGGRRRALAEAKDRLWQPSYLEHPRPLALRPCLTTGLPLSVTLSVACTQRLSGRYTIDV